jgi:hypothetical protein
MNEPEAPRHDATTSNTQPSGGKGLAIVLGAMIGIIGLLWLVAALVSPH